MNYYKYVNRTPNTITIGNYTIPPFDGIVSPVTIPSLDHMDGVLVDKYIDGVAILDTIEYNYNHPVVSHAKGDGLLLNKDNPQFGWHDLLSATTVDRDNASSMPNFAVFAGTIKKYQFAINDESFHNFHLPHDYLPGSDLYIHVHWAHTSEAVTGGSVTWQFEVSYAKGYNQEVFNTPKILTVSQNVINTPRTHQIAETRLSVPGGSATQLDSDLVETDGLLLVKTSLIANTIGTDPFMIFCDLHYQSTNIPTKNRNADFWS